MRHGLKHKWLLSGSKMKWPKAGEHNREEKKKAWMHIHLNIQVGTCDLSVTEKGSWPS